MKQRYISPTIVQRSYFDLRMHKAKKMNNQVKPKPFKPKAILRVSKANQPNEGE